MIKKAFFALGIAAAGAMLGTAATVVVLEKAGHMVQMERPTEVNELLLAQLP